MASKAFLLAVAVAFCCSLKAQTSVPSVLFRGNCETGLPRFEDWYRQTRLPQGEPYVAAQDRKQQTTNNYLKLKLQMSLAEVEKLLGKPDFATGRPVPRPAASPEPTDRRCSAETAYVLNKNNENMTDLQDVAIYLFFSRDGKLYWAAPQNLPNLKPLGSPSGETLIVQSQSLWKEYIFADDRFAITLPEEPNPHTDATLPDFTVYSVSLPGNARLSLRVSHQDRDCAATLAELKEGALKGRSGVDPSSVMNPSIDGTQGLEYKYTFNGGPVQSDRFYCVSGKFYAFSTRWFGGQVRPASVERVFASFRLLNTKSTEGPQ
jgi:hypothetical protein